MNQDNLDLERMSWTIYSEQTLTVYISSIHICIMCYILSKLHCNYYSNLITTWKRLHNELSSTMSTSSCLFFQSVSGQIALDDRDPMIRSATPWIVLVVRYITRILSILHVIYLYLTCLVYVMNLEISDMHLIWTCKLLCHSWLDG